MEKLSLLENPELLQYCIATMAGVILTADVLIKRYLKNRRKKAAYALLKRRFEYFRY
ncbi:MAG: hypothetical protein J6B00_04015 [Alphaproteobacteria bacterium]|nr:hypothetical protein [Alphaproteobacteria bacterium]MBO5285024.1 hypothetical protein [Alphaproteobacteria bacterium]